MAKRITAGQYRTTTSTGEFFVERREIAGWWITGWNHDGVMIVSDGFYPTKALALRKVDVYDAFFRLRRTAT